MVAPVHESWTVDKLMALPLDQLYALWKTLPAPDFHPTTATQGDGHNVWRKARGVIRRMRYGTYAGVSLLDGEPAYVVRYGDFQNPAGDLDMTDEIRRLDDGLYIGVATSKNGDGTRTEPDLFLLSGPVGPWIGVDNQQAELK